MSLETIIYLADVLPNIRTIAGIVMTITTLGIALSFDYALAYETWAEKKFKWPIKTLLITTIICLITCIFVPSKEAIYMMAGVSATKQIANTPEAEKALKILNLGLDKAISKLQDK